jgi:hypothetical protein
MTAVVASLRRPWRHGLGRVAIHAGTSEASQAMRLGPSCLCRGNIQWPRRNRWSSAIVQFSLERFSGPRPHRSSPAQHTRASPLAFWHQHPSLYPVDVVRGNAMTTQSMRSGATKSNGICGDCRIVARGRRKVLNFDQNDHFDTRAPRPQCFQGIDRSGILLAWPHRVMLAPDHADIQ